MTKGINNGKDIDSDFMDSVYKTIEEDPISLAEDDAARFKQKSEGATSYKKRQELFQEEGQWLTKLGQEAIKGQNATQFQLVN